MICLSLLKTEEDVILILDTVQCLMSNIKYSNAIYECAYTIKKKNRNLIKIVFFSYSSDTTNTSRSEVATDPLAILLEARFEPCQVCGEQSSGLHCGAITCEACKV